LKRLRTAQQLKDKAAIELSGMLENSGAFFFAQKIEAVSAGRNANNRINYPCRGHITSFVMWHMKQRLRPLMDSDGQGAHRKNSFDHIMNSLKSLQKSTIDVSGIKSSFVAVPTVEQSSILRLLGVNL